MNKPQLIALTALIALVLGGIMGYGLKPDRYSHGHSDGVLSSLFTEYLRINNMNTDGMTEMQLLNHNALLDHYENHINQILNSKAPYSPEHAQAWKTEIQPLRKAKTSN